MERLMELGAKLGLEKKELLEFVSEQQRLERDERATQRQLEKEKIEAQLEEKKLEAEERKRRDELERVAAERQFQMEQEKMKQAHELAMERERKVSNDNGGSTQRGNDNCGMAKAPKLPAFVDGKDDLDAYIERFERFAKIQKWKEENWAVALSALLTGKALEVYARLSTEEANNYKQVKTALLKRYNLTEEGFRSRFRESKPEANESPGQFVTRITNYLERWVELAGVEHDYVSLRDLILKEQFISVCPKDLAVYLKEKPFERLTEMCAQAERFLEAHGKTLHTNKQSRNDSPKEVNDKMQQQGKTKTCFNCQKVGHVKTECRNKGGGNEQQCSKCKLYGHLVEVCRYNKQGAAAVRVDDSDKEKKGETIKEETEEKNEHDEKLKVVKTRVNNHVLRTLRDSGATAVCINKKFVNENQFTGEYSSCRFLDGTVVRAETAMIDVDTPYLKQNRVNAVCLTNPTYDLVIGDVPGARCKCNPDPEWELKDVVAAVSTRSQAKAAKKYLNPLKVRGADGNEEEITPEVLIKLQEDDDTLDKVRNSQRTDYECRGNIWYRRYERPKGEVVDQLVVPESLRKKVMSMAHESLMGGHLGVRKTRDKVQACFYWPGINGDITRFCRSCDICQRTVSKGKVPKVHLGNMPIIDVPFKRVAVDIVGPITPMTERRNRYVLTMVDIATRYPEAVPLRDITTETVAEALVDMFSRLGVPEEILSDQGTQFTSEMMKEVSRLLSVRQLVTTPYHPMANGLCEKFNGTLKQMLKRLCEKKPQDWDRYVNAALFAYREAPQESTGFAPFELLYGRKVRGPLSILKQLWTREIDEPDVKTTYQYVVDLREKLEECMADATQSLEKSKKRYKKYYDRKTKDRKFEKGEKVLLLLPTASNKLLMQWAGPYEVEEVLSQNDYKVQVRGKVKTYHANLLKKYVSREEHADEKPMEGVYAAVIDSSDSQPSDVVDDEHLLELCYKGGKETIKDVDINGDLNAAQKTELEDAMQEFEAVFTEKPGITNLEEHKIQVTSDTPIRSKPYPIPYNCRESLKADLQEMLDMGIIEKAETPYSSPIVIVKKRDGSNRVCVDYRKLNKISVFDGEPTAIAEDIFAKVSRDKYLSTIDLSKGYWQIPVAPEDVAKTGFVTPDGCYVFRRLPFGLMNSAATFNRMMRKLLDGVDHVDSYIDDICIHTETWEEHLQVLREVLQRIRDAGLTIKPSKCHIGFGKIEYLGHSIGSGEKGLNKENVEKVVAAERPATKKQVRSLLGLTGFYRSYIPNYATIAVPLTDLTKKGCPEKVEWGEAQEHAFVTLKQHLTNDPILKLPDMEKEFVLRTDASNVGVGAVLMQEHDGDLFPVAYASKKLSERERRYSVSERECLALVWAIKKFQVYLYGRTFTLQTDHQPLVYIDRCKVENARIMRWALFLQSYTMRIEAIKGQSNVGADYMSRV